MINKIYDCFRKFYKHSEELKFLSNKSGFINIYKDIFKKSIYFVDKNKKRNSFNKNIIFLSKEKDYNSKKRSLEARTILFAHLFGIFAHSSKDENFENKNKELKKKYILPHDLKTNINENIDEKNEVNKINENIKIFTGSNEIYNLNKEDNLSAVKKNKELKDEKYEYYQELSEYSNMQIFTSNSHHELANEICSNLGISLGRAYVGKYSDGEIALQIMDEVRGRDIFIIHSTPSGGKNVHSRLMELFLFISTLRRSSAKKVTVVIPYLNYSRQAKQLDDFNYVHSLGAPEVAILLQTCGADAIISVDLHNPRIEGFSTENDLQPPLMNIYPQSLAVEYFKKKNLHNPVIVSIDNEGGERTKEFWVRMKKYFFDVGFTTVASSTVSEMNNREGYPSNEINENDFFSNEYNINYKKKKQENDAENSMKTDEINYKEKEGKNYNLNNSENIEDKNKKNINPYEKEKYTIVGDIKGCDCILIDDIIDTGQKSQKVSALLKNAGARKIYLYATHAILSDGCIEKINDSCIDEVVTTNTIHIPSNICCEKLHILSVAKLVAEGIKRAHNEQSQNQLEDFSDRQIEMEKK